MDRSRVQESTSYRSSLESSYFLVSETFKPTDPTRSLDDVKDGTPHVISDLYLDIE